MALYFVSVGDPIRWGWLISINDSAAKPILLHTPERGANQERFNIGMSAS
jgi:hypothetical protein